MKGQNGRRIRTNDELQVMYREPNIIANKSKKTRWADNLEGISDDRTVKKYYWGNQTEVEKQEDQNVGG